MNQITDIATLVLIVAAITVLVRPKSQGPGLVNAVFGGFAGLVKQATT